VIHGMQLIAMPNARRRWLFSIMPSESAKGHAARGRVSGSSRAVTIYVERAGCVHEAKLHEAFGEANAPNGYVPWPDRRSILLILPAIKAAEVHQDPA
jgi:hypothetical protein